MKKLMMLTLILIGGTAMAQTSFGLKGGLNYGATGDYESISDGFNDVMSIKGKNKSGYHIGGFGKFEFAGIFIQPEIVYTSLTTDYDTFDYKLNKLDVPVLLGINILGPVNIKAGPSFQYVLNNKLEDSDFKIGVVENDITVGYQLGAGLNLGRLGFDVRYESAFKENTAFSETASNNFSIDSRPNQWILSAYYSFN